MFDAMPTGRPSAAAMPSSAPQAVALRVRPKIGLPPSAWAPNPLDEPVDAQAVIAIDRPPSPWSPKFVLGLLVLLLALNFSLSLFFNRLPSMADEPEMRPRLHVIRAEETAVTPEPVTGTGVYRHIPVVSTPDTPLPELRPAPDTNAGALSFSLPDLRVALHGF